MSSSRYDENLRDDIRNYISQQEKKSNVKTPGTVAYIKHTMMVKLEDFVRSNRRLTSAIQGEIKGNPVCFQGGVIGKCTFEKLYDRINAASNALVTGVADRQDVKGGPNFPAVPLNVGVPASGYIQSTRAGTIPRDQEKQIIEFCKRSIQGQGWSEVVNFTVNSSGENVEIMVSSPSRLREFHEKFKERVDSIVPGGIDITAIFETFSIKVNLIKLLEVIQNDLRRCAKQAADTLRKQALRAEDLRVEELKVEALRQQAQQQNHSIVAGSYGLAQPIANPYSPNYSTSSSAPYSTPQVFGVVTGNEAYSPAAPTVPAQQGYTGGAQYYNQYHSGSTTTSHGHPSHPTPSVPIFYGNTSSPTLFTQHTPTVPPDRRLCDKLKKTIPGCERLVCVELGMCESKLGYYTVKLTVNGGEGGKNAEGAKAVEANIKTFLSQKLGKRISNLDRGGGFGFKIHSDDLHEFLGSAPVQQYRPS